MVGLGKIGANMTARLLAAGHHLVVFDRNPDAVRTSVEKGAPVITASLMMRFVSRQEESFAAKLLAALRNQFGGHAVKRSE